VGQEYIQISVSVSTEFRRHPGTFVGLAPLKKAPEPLKLKYEIL